MSDTPVEFPPDCPHCGWQLHPPVAWLVIRAALAASRAAGVARWLPIVDAELARSRAAYPRQEEGTGC